jgi:hypothetical protein
MGSPLTDREWTTTMRTRFYLFRSFNSVIILDFNLGIYYLVVKL